MQLMPKATKHKPPIILQLKFSRPSKGLRYIKLNVSRVKVEKVVKPPRQPVMAKSFIYMGISGCLRKKPEKIPMRKQPVKFTIRVA